MQRLEKHDRLQRVAAEEEEVAVLRGGASENTREQSHQVLHTTHNRLLLERNTHLLQRISLSKQRRHTLLRRLLRKHPPFLRTPQGICHAKRRLLPTHPLAHRRLRAALHHTTHHAQPVVESTCPRLLHQRTRLEQVLDRLARPLHAIHLHHAALRRASRDHHHTITLLATVPRAEDGHRRLFAPHAAAENASSYHQATLLHAVQAARNG